MDIQVPQEQILSIRIVTPKEVIFTGQAFSITSTNSKGKFDILPQHANFITLIQNQPIIIRMPNNQQKIFKFPLAIMYIISNKVSIYTDIQIHESNNV